MKKLTLVLTIAVVMTFAATAVFAQPYTPTVAGDTYDSAPDAIPTPNSNNQDATPDIYDAVNSLYTLTGLGNPGHTSNEDIDFLQFTGPDNTWKDLSGTTGNPGTFVLIGLRAANTNTLGIYEAADPTNQSTVLGPFSGTTLPGEPFTAVEFNPGFDFGWTLNSVGIGGNNTYSSDPTLGNYDNAGLDHMMTYHLSDLAGQTIQIEVCDADGTNCGTAFDYELNDPYLLAWEDLPLGALQGGLLGDEDYDDIMFLVDNVAPTTPIPEPMSMVLLGGGLAAMAARRRNRS